MFLINARQAEEADMGFIFRKVHKPEVKKKAPEPVTNGLISPLLVNGSHEPGPLLVNGYRGRSLEDESMTSQDSTEHNISLNDSLLGGEILEGGQCVDVDKL